MKLSEITPIQVLGGVLVVNTVLAGGSTQLTDLFGPAMANHILSVCILGSGICGGFIMQMGGLPSQARNVIAAGGAIDVSAHAAPALATMAMDPTQQKIGPAPGASAAVAAIAKSAASALLLALALSFLLAPDPASAQARVKQGGPVLTGDLIQDAKDKFQGDPSKGVQLTGNLKKDAATLWASIQGAALVDLQYATAMAGAAGTNGSSIRKQCWDAIIVVNQQSNGAGLKDANGQPMTKPDPHLFTDVETAAEVLDNLSPQGKLFTSCAGAAQLAQANVIQFISAAITGVAGMAKLAPIPGL